MPSICGLADQRRNPLSNRRLKMRFLADMGISITTVNWLRSKGYNAIHAREIGMQRSSDTEIIKRAQSDSRIVITCDLDFGALMASAQEYFPSIIIFRLQNEKPLNINQRLDTVLTSSSNDLSKGAVITVEENRYRIRHLPIK
jgi:predicted nuclease of predicted toxin-antitoxin system